MSGAVQEQALPDRGRSSVRAMRPATLEALGLGSVLDIFRRGALPVDVESAGRAGVRAASDRGALVISGGNGIVGAGKTMQLGSRLEPLGVRVIALDFPAARTGIGRQYPGLVRRSAREARRPHHEQASCGSRTTGGRRLAISRR